MMTPKDKSIDQNARQLARSLYGKVRAREYALTAVATAVQERLNSDVVLSPRDGGRARRAIVYTTRVFRNDGTIHHRHVVCFAIPDARQGGHEFAMERLRVVLEIGHELGHLVLEQGPGAFRQRWAGDDAAMLNKIGELEADWFGLCILQMYGFVNPHS